MDFIYYVASSNPLLWVDTIEYDRAIQNISANCINTLNCVCFSWNIIQGIKLLNKNINKITIDNEDISPSQPINYLISLKTKHNIIFCNDYHIFFNNSQDSIELWRLLLNNLDTLKENNNTFVIVSPFNKIPIEIEKYFSIIEFQLPTKKELLNILNNFDISDLPNNQIECILNNGLGLTHFEFENALALSITKYGEIKPDTIFEQKKQLLKRNSCLEICNYNKGFKDIAGLDVLKDFSKNMIISKKGRGICLLGVPGTGKSYFAKCLGKETNRLTISLNFGKLMGSLVGETERNTRETLKTIDALAPCILFIDEIEKNLIGINGGNNDSGVGVRQGGQFLTWLNDHESDVYVIATANDVSKLPSELLRAERWDAIFFVDLPNQIERESLLSLYEDEYNLEHENIDLEGYTGAEIKSLCRIAFCLKKSLREALKYINPVSVTSYEKIKALREWAKDRTINASAEYNHNNFSVKNIKDYKKENYV